MSSDLPCPSVMIYHAMLLWYTGLEDPFTFKRGLATESPAWNFSFACFVHLAAHDEPYIAYYCILPSKKKHPKLTTTRNRFRYSKYFSTMNYLQASDYTAQLFLCRCLIRAQIALLAKNQTATDTLLIEMMNILSETHAHTQTYIYIL